MEKSPVLCSFIGTGSLAIGGLLSLALPKDTGMSEDTEASDDVGVHHSTLFLRPFVLFKTAVSALKDLLRQNTHLGALLISLIFTTIGHLESSVSLQYSVKRYGWTWGKASRLIIFCCLGS